MVDNDIKPDMSSTTIYSYKAFKERRKSNFREKEDNFVPEEEYSGQDTIINGPGLKSVKQGSMGENANVPEGILKKVANLAVGHHGAIDQGPVLGLLQQPSCHEAKSEFRHSYQHFKASRKSLVSLWDTRGNFSVDQTASISAIGGDDPGGWKSEEVVISRTPNVKRSSQGNDTPSMRSLKLLSKGLVRHPQCDQVIETLLARASSLLDEFRVLEAHEMLLAAERHLAEASATEEEVMKLHTSAVFRSVASRLEQYLIVRDQTLALTVNSEPLSLVWEVEGAKLFVYSPGESWFVLRVVLEIDAPLAHCMVVGNELDLKTAWQPNLAEAPRVLGPRKRLHLITQSITSLLLFKIDVVVEVQRFCNKEFGFLAERLQSTFPAEGIQIPDVQPFAIRIAADSSNLWLPRGGGAEGTVLIHSARLEAGIPIPEEILSVFLSSFASSFVESMRSMAKKPSEPGNPWADRLVLDKDGLYGELFEVEKAANNRQEVSAAHLPSLDIFQIPLSSP